MDFELNELQSMLRDSVTRFLEKDYGFETRRTIIHELGGLSEANWRVFAEMGWLGASLPEEFGGLGGGAIEVAVICEAFGRALVVEPFLAVGIVAAQALLAAGGGLARALLPAIAAGERRIVLAHSEIAARGDPSFVSTRAARSGGTYVLNGVKSLVLGAPFADSLLVSARTEGADEAVTGISLFLVPADAPGISLHAFRLADGSRAAEVSLADVAIDATDRIGEEGRGFDALDHAVAHGIVAACAEAVGAMERALWITRDHVQTRRQFGQAIGSFQSVQHRMADMLIELELARSALFRALAHIGSPAPDRRRAMALAKLQMGKSARFIGSQAIQLHGGIGVTEEYSIGHYFKRLTFLDTLFGPPQLHLRTIAATY